MVKSRKKLRSRRRIRVSKRRYLFTGGRGARKCGPGESPASAFNPSGCIP